MKSRLDKINKAIYDQRALDLDDDFDKLQAQKAIKAAEHAKLQYLCQSTESRIASNRMTKNKYVEVKAALQKQVIGIGNSNEDDVDDEDVVDDDVDNEDDDDEDCKDE